MIEIIKFLKIIQFLEKVAFAIKQCYTNLKVRRSVLFRDFIISEISKKRPNENVLEGSEFKILTREYGKLRRQLPIRVLLEQIFNLVLDIKPVFLMSPLSVSTYLASELNIFDWGLSDFYIKDYKYTLTIGSRYYKAPELLMDYKKYDFAIDMWGVGCLFGAILFQIDY